MHCPWPCSALRMKSGLHSTSHSKQQQKISSTFFISVGWGSWTMITRNCYGRVVSERASLKNVFLILLASTGLKSSADQLAAWTGLNPCQKKPCCEWGKMSCWKAGRTLHLPVEWAVLRPPLVGCRRWVGACYSVHHSAAVDAGLLGKERKIRSASLSYADSSLLCTWLGSFQAVQLSFWSSGPIFSVVLCLLDK